MPIQNEDEKNLDVYKFNQSEILFQLVECNKHESELKGPCIPLLETKK